MTVAIRELPAAGPALMGVLVASLVSDSVIALDGFAVAETEGWRYFPKWSRLYTQKATKMGRASRV